MLTSFGHEHLLANNLEYAFTVECEAVTRAARGSASIYRFERTIHSCPQNGRAFCGGIAGRPLDQRASRATFRLIHSVGRQVGGDDSIRQIRGFPTAAQRANETDIREPPPGAQIDLRLLRL